MSDLDRLSAINKTRALMTDLIAHLEAHPTTMNADVIYDLSNAIHGAMCVADWPELNWMDITFEDVASSLRKAEHCIATSDDDGFTDDDTDRLREIREGGL